jgi:hypothetical protein
MPVSPEGLIDELLYNVNVSGGKTLEKRIADLAVWFHRNKGRIPLDNLAARQAFLTTAFETMIEVQALLIERQHELEALKRGRSRLWLPRGMKVNGQNEFT